jgi:hypothetical protein
MLARTSLAAPGGDFIIYLCSGSGPARPGDLTQQLAALDADLRVVLVDTSIGGSAHDLLCASVVDALEILAGRHECKAKFGSPLCRSFFALQHAPDGLGPCRDLSSPDGFVRDDGAIRSRAAEGNAVLQACLRIALAAASHNAAVAFESPVSRGAGTKYAISGREAHAAMWDTSFWRAFAAQVGDASVDFDQCLFSAGSRRNAWISQNHEHCRR